MKSSTRRRWSSGLILMLAMQSAGLLFAQKKPNAFQEEIKKYSISAASEDQQKLTPAQVARLVREKIKYVFVIYQENRSFDSYFGTFPGAEGLFSKSPDKTPGFYQEIKTTYGSVEKIRPFRIGPKEFAADTDDVDHSHAGIVAKVDFDGARAKMDRFALTEENDHIADGKMTSHAKQYGELTMAYEDCDTVPLLWAYADKFVLFDHIFQLMTGPSTPGNLSIIGAQTGVTQWILHPGEAYTDNGNGAPGVPVLNDNNPFWGSPLDPTPLAQRMPVNPGDNGNYGTAKNLTFATLPLTLMGGNLSEAVKSDKDRKNDLGDVEGDVSFISRLKQPTITFGWYEEGYDKEPTDDDDDDPVDAAGLHASYITHHNGPQYFGYISNNPEMRRQLHGLEDFFDAVRDETLPAPGGVFYIKGGSQNQMGLKPADPDPKVQKNFLGDDDHPAYSDAQISEAMVAEVINKIAASKYWPSSAIIITWDDSEGDYDHVPPPMRARGPDGSVISDGPRVPLILISPYARTDYISPEQGNHASVVKFIDTVFGLTPLAKLPDELAARDQGKKKLGQPDLGPEDAITPNVTDLLDAFSPSRLTGNASPLPKDYVWVNESQIRHLPQETHYGCKDLGVTPTDRGIPNQIPHDFNPRPSTDPSN